MLDSLRGVVGITGIHEAFSERLCFAYGLFSEYIHLYFCINVFACPSIFYTHIFYIAML